MYSKVKSLLLRADEAPLCSLQVLHVLADPVPDPQHGSRYLPSC